MATEIPPNYTFFKERLVCGLPLLFFYSGGKNGEKMFISKREKEKIQDLINKNTELFDRVFALVQGMHDKSEDLKADLMRLTARVEELEKTNDIQLKNIEKQQAIIHDMGVIQNYSMADALNEIKH